MFDLHIFLTCSVFRVNYLEYEGVRLAQSAWCSIPFTESEARGNHRVTPTPPLPQTPGLLLPAFKLENIHLVQTFNFEKKYMWWIIFCVAGSLYLMLASTIVYFVIPLLVVILLYSRLVLFSHLKL